MKKFLGIILLLTIFSSFVSAQEGYTPSEENLKSREEFSNDRFGVFIHWGIYSMLARGEWALQEFKLSFNEYSNLAKGFCPSEFNAEEWVKVFKAAGAKYVTITSRHHDGFAMFGSKASGFNVVDATPFKRDVIKELSEACAKEGLKLHFYYSHLDWGRNDYYPLGGSGHNTGRPEGDENSWEHYINFMCDQVTELLTNYGPIRCIWFDGIWDKKGKDLDDCAKMWQLDRQYELIHRLQPGCMVATNHHHSNYPGEDMQLFEKDLPGKNTTGFVEDTSVSEDLPLETCETIDNSWGYKIYDNKVKSAETLIRFLAQTAGNGSNLLLNIGPRPDGTLPEESVDRLLAIGKWLEKYGETIYGTKGGAIGDQAWGVATKKDNVLFIHNLNGTGSIFVPVSGCKLVSATAFDGGGKVAARQVPEGIVISLPARPENCPDQIIRLTFKENLK